MPGGKPTRPPVAEREVWPMPNAVDAPSINLRRRVFQRHELQAVQTFIAQSPLNDIQTHPWCKRDLVPSSAPVGCSKISDLVLSQHIARALVGTARPSGGSRSRVTERATPALTAVREQAAKYPRYGTVFKNFREFRASRTKTQTHVHARIRKRDLNGRA